MIEAHLKQAEHVRFLLLGQKFWLLLAGVRPIEIAATHPFQVTDLPHGWRVNKSRLLAAFSSLVLIIIIRSYTLRIFFCGSFKRRLLLLNVHFCLTDVSRNLSSVVVI